MADQSTYWALTDLSGGVDRNLGGKLQLTVNDVELPMSQFSMTYGLNAIPNASALIAMGYNVRTLERSRIYDEIQNIKQMAPVVVRVTGELGDWSPRGDGGVRIQWPTADSIIFTGYVSGISYRRSMGGINLVLNMVNQLVDLAMSSGGSADVVPGAPHDLMLPLYADGAGGKPAGTSASKFIEELPDDLSTDFSRGLLKALHYVSQDNQLQTHQAWCDGAAGTDNPASEQRANQRAAQAIRGFGFWNGIESYTQDPAESNYVKPYPLQIHSTGRQHVAQRIGNKIAASFASTSMWGLLVGSLLPEFGVGIVPTAQTAFIAPILPMSRQANALVELGPNDQADFNFKALSQRPLYGVGVMGNYQTAVLAKGESDNKQCVGATFVAKADDASRFNDGMWMFVPAPDWMDDWTNFDPQALDGEPAAAAMLSNPSHDAAGLAQPAVQRNPDDEVNDWNNVMERYAQMIYAANALRGREGTIVSKLRFDICPGTTIRVKSNTDRNSDGVSELAVDLLGLVAQVTVNINAESATASTTLKLTNLRTDVENLSDRFSLESHPFFDENFFEQAPLVPSLTVTE